MQAELANLRRYTLNPTEILTHANGPTEPIQVNNTYQPSNQAAYTTQYSYNSNDNLVGKTVNGVRTNFTLDPAGALFVRCK